MGAVDDPVEAGTAAAAINTVQLISGAFGAGLAGVVVNMTHGGDAVSARWLFAVFAVLAAGGLRLRIARRAADRSFSATYTVIVPADPASGPIGDKSVCINRTLYSPQ